MKTIGGFFLVLILSIAPVVHTSAQTQTQNRMTPILNPTATLDDYDQEDLKNTLLSLRRKIRIAFDAHAITLESSFLLCLSGELDLNSESCESVRRLIAAANLKHSEMKIHLALSVPEREANSFLELTRIQAPYRFILNPNPQHPFRGQITMNPLNESETTKAIELFQRDLVDARKKALESFAPTWQDLYGSMDSFEIENFHRREIENLIYSTRATKRSAHYQKYLDIMNGLPLVALIPRQVNLDNADDRALVKAAFEKILANTTLAMDFVNQIPDSSWKSLLPLMKYKPMVNEEVFGFFTPNSPLSPQHQTQILQLFRDAHSRDELIAGLGEMGLILGATLSCSFAMRSVAGLVANVSKGIIARGAAYLGARGTSETLSRALSCGFMTGMPLNIWFTYRDYGRFNQNMIGFFTSPHGQQMLIELEQLSDADRDLSISFLFASIGAGIGPIFKTTMLPRLAPRLSPAAHTFVRRALTIF